MVTNVTCSKGFVNYKRNNAPPYFCFCSMPNPA